MNPSATSHGPGMSITKVTALSLLATGPLLTVGSILHPHAPDAQSMAEVAYVQTGQTAWWPAHVFLLLAYVAFSTFLVGVSRIDRLPDPVTRVLTFALPLACLGVAAMVVHLLLPVGRDSVANSQEGWAFWVKDVAESADAVMALVLGAVAWSLGRAGIIGNRLTASLGLAGGLGVAAFSIAVPLTGWLLPMDLTRVLVLALPVFGILILIWTVSAGVMALAYRPQVG
jgi:hypothetical protein